MSEAIRDLFARAKIVRCGVFAALDFMNRLHTTSESIAIPGHRWAFCLPHETDSTLRLAVSLKDAAESSLGRLVMLRQTSDACVYLGAVCDRAGRARELLEIWVQRLRQGDSAETNLAADKRWQAVIAAMSHDDRFVGELGGAEAPIFIDGATMSPLHPEVNGDALRLCKDSKALADAGLTPYETSDIRHGMANGGVVALGPASKELAALVPPKAVPFNADASGMFARMFAPFSLWDFAEILGGKAWSGLLNAKIPVRLGGIYAGLEDLAKPRISGAHFFSAGRDFAGRLPEVLCLKLATLEQCVRLAAAETERSELPFLCIGEDSFRVELGDAGQNLPHFWNFKTVLSHASGAVALDFPSSRERYFAPREDLRGSIYRPDGWDLRRKGVGNVRLRKVFSPAANGTAVEGTLSTQERTGLQPNELIRLHLPTDHAHRMEIFAGIGSDAGLAAGDIPFRSIPSLLSPEKAAALKSCEGTFYSQVEYEIFLPLSTPADLYALGVTGLRILFAGSEKALAALVDDALRLLAAVGQLPAAEPLEKRLVALFEKDPRWAAALGPQFLCAGTPDCLPVEMWSRILASVLPLFPAQPDSFARDLADAESLAPHTAYHAPLRALEYASRSARALFLSDWRRNEEMAEILASYLSPR